MHHYTPKKEGQSKQWSTKGEAAPKKGEDGTTSWEGDGDRFLDSHRIVFIDYLQKGKAITKEYYVSSLDELKAEIAKENHRISRRKAFPSGQRPWSHVDGRHG